MRPVLVASKDQTTPTRIQASLGDEYKVDRTRDLNSCLTEFKKKRYEFTFIDLELLKNGETTPANGRLDFVRIFKPFRQTFPSALIVIMIEPGNIREAVKAVKAGADDYLTYPLDAEEVKYVAQNLYESDLMQHELDYLRDQIWLGDLGEAARTASPLMAKVFDNVRLVAPTRSTVLITGETGTGKSFIAQLIHRLSSRREMPFIAVHCGAIPDTLIESELFGHEKGAFTGAIRKKLGKFEMAQGGTIFLDEIGTITPSTQIKLLQVLQDRSFQRVGAEALIQADVRVVAATNDDLWKRTEEGGFRRDLLFRLNVFPLKVPPLRERLEDVPILVETFLSRLNTEYTKEIRGAHPEVMEGLAGYDWPGNVRELENIIERAFIIEKSDQLTPSSFPAEFFESPPACDMLSVDESLTLAEIRKVGMDEIECRYLHELLTKYRGKINKTAEHAGISPRQLHKLMTRHGLKKETYK